MSTAPVTSGPTLPVRHHDSAPSRVELDGSPDDGAVAWVEQHRDALRTGVRRHGALLVRGLDLRTDEQAVEVVSVLADELLDDREAFAQRSERGPGVYSSATWPDHQPMCMHHELSYRLRVPSLVMCVCLTAPTTGGATGVADAADVLEQLPADLVARFEREGWLLRRTYGLDIGPGLVEAFGTDDRDEVEAYCRAHGIETAWGPDGELSTRQRRRAVVRHPHTGRRSWVNQVAFLSEWTLDPEVREFLVDVYGEEGLPFTTAYGDGAPVEAEVVELLNATYDAHTRREPWRAGDLLLIDNLATAHSREAFTGERDVLVAMADPVDLDALAVHP